MLIVDENCYQKLDMAPTFVSMAATTIKKIDGDEQANNQTNKKI